MKEIEVLKPILEKFIEKRKKIREGIIKDGIVPAEICELCEGYGYKIQIMPLDEKEKQKVSRFLKSMKNNQIVSVNPITDFRELVHPTYNIIIETTKKLGRKKPEILEENLYRYTYPLSYFRKRKFLPKIFKQLFEKYSRVSSCPHFKIDEAQVLHLNFKRARSVIIDTVTVEEQSYDALFLCCELCKARTEKFGCTDGVIKNGFIFKERCDLNSLLLRKLLNESNIPFEISERSDHFWSTPQFYLRQLETLILLPYSSASFQTFTNSIESIISVLKPKLVVCFGEKSELLNFLGFDINVLIVSEKGFYFYDQSRPVEKSIDVIVDNIVKKLDDYAERIRGNEHDRLLKAFEKIGQELGYVTEREHSKKGVRVDCVWYDREGKSIVAIEVETRGGWKKDIISTWELEPNLAVIVTYQKTDAVPKALMDFALMKNMPHKLLYINMETKNGFLFDKQQILKKYNLETSTEKDFKLIEM